MQPVDKMVSLRNNLRTNAGLARLKVSCYCHELRCLKASEAETASAVKGTLDVKCGHPHVGPVTRNHLRLKARGLTDRA